MNFKRILAAAAIAIVSALTLGGQTVTSGVVQIQLTATVPESANVVCSPMTWPVTDGAVTINCTADFNTQDGRFTRDVSLVNADNSTPRSVLTPVIDRW
jgi:hypothetical protein